MTSPFLGELLGTMVLIILGNGVVAGALLKNSKAEGAGWIAITAGWAFAVLAGIFVATATGSPDAHINPAVTLAAAITAAPPATRSTRRGISARGSRTRSCRSPARAARTAARTGATP
jgi:glycerol uptake facilitator protein